MDFLPLIKEVGLLSALCAAFAWMLFWLVRKQTEDGKAREDRILQGNADRETRMATRIDVLEDAMRTELVVLVKDGTDVMSGVKEGQQETSAAVDRLTTVIGRCEALQRK